MVLQNLQSDQLVKTRKGYLSISTTEWLTTSLDSICAGSSLECKDSVYFASADETVDSLAGIGAIGNNTVVYVLFDPSTLAFYVTSTAPQWDDSSQGWYSIASPTHRCIFRFYKVSAGVYNKKCILDSRPAIYLKQYDHELDAYAYSTAGTSVLWHATTKNVAGAAAATKIFYLKKPVIGIAKTTNISGNYTAGYNINTLFIAAKSGYRAVHKTTTISTSPVAGSSEFLFNLNPGKYKWISRQDYGVGGNNNGSKRHTIYIHGMYGGTSITKTACIDT